MDWSNERYVRLYTRDTPEWACMPWQGKALWPLLIRKLDRSGVLATRLGAKGISALTGLPIEVVEPGLDALLEDGCLIPHQLGFVAPNFMDAQEAHTSDKQRQRFSRERRRLVTNRDTESQNVTECHNRSQPVTTGHTVSQPVTPSLAVPSLAEPNQIQNMSAKSPTPSGSVGSAPKRKAKREWPPAKLESAHRVLAKLTAANGIKYRGSDEHIALIVNQLELGVTEMELRAVVAYCAGEWEGKESMQTYLRPETLFGPKTISKYLDPARTRFAAELAKPRLEVVQ